MFLRTIKTRKEEFFRPTIRAKLIGAPNTKELPEMEELGKFRP